MIGHHCVMPSAKKRLSNENAPWTFTHWSVHIDLLHYLIRLINYWCHTAHPKIITFKSDKHLIYDVLTDLSNGLELTEQDKMQPTLASTLVSGVETFGERLLMSLVWVLGFYDTLSKPLRAVFICSVVTVCVIPVCYCCGKTCSPFKRPPNDSLYECFKHSIRTLSWSECKVPKISNPLPKVFEIKSSLYVWWLLQGTEWVVCRRWQACYIASGVWGWLVFGALRPGNN